MLGTPLTLCLALLAGIGEPLSVAAANDRPARRQMVGSVSVEVEHRPDGKKRPNYVKESYSLSPDGKLDYSAYFGGIPMNMNHMDGTEWLSGAHGKRVFDAVRKLLADPAHGPGLVKESDDDSARGLRGVYRVRVTDESGDSTWYAKPGTRAFARIDEAFGALIAAFENATGRPRKPGDLPQ